MITTQDRYQLWVLINQWQFAKPGEDAKNLANRIDALLNAIADKRTCKTCVHWKIPKEEHFDTIRMCEPTDPDTYKPMERGFKTKLCTHPSQARFEPPSASNYFALTDASQYYAALVTGEDFGCVLHE